jgi:Mad3/BUB1 homology region 1
VYVGFTRTAQRDTVSKMSDEDDPPHSSQHQQSEEVEEQEPPPPAWERCKENTAPRRSGRNVAVLTASLQSSQHEKDRLYEFHKSQVENLSESNHPDPLQPWIDFLHYVNTFHRPNEPIPTHLLEECVLQFYDADRYRNDVRYCTICCRYANADDEPLEMYKILFQRGIGTMVARFYCAWAWNAERLHDFPLAEQVLEKGLEVKARPFEQLSTWYQQVMRRKQSRERQQLLLEGGDDGSLLEQQQRATLGRLGAESVRRNDRRPSAAASTASTASLSTFTDRTAQRQQQQQRAAARTSNRNQQQHPASSGWEIHCDDDHEDGHGDLLGPSGQASNNALDHFLAARRVQQQQLQEEEAGGAGVRAPASPSARITLHRQAERRKENLPRVEAWNERGQGLVSAAASSLSAAATATAVPASYAAKPPTFQVFVDPECAANIEQEERTRRDELDRQKQWIRGGGTGGGGGNSRAGGRGGSSHAAAATAGGTSKNRTTAKPPRLWWDVDNAAFDTQLLVDEAGEERCFEEARAYAGHYRLLDLPDKDLEPASASSSFESSADMDESADMMVMRVVDRLNLSAIENDNDPRRDVRRRMHRSSASESWDASRSAGRLGGCRDADADASTATASVASAATAPSVAGPSPTVNTKWALNQLSVMFYSPGPASAARTTNNKNNRSRIGTNLSMMLPPSRGEDLHSSLLVRGTDRSDIRDDASLEQQQHEDSDRSSQDDDRKPPARGGGFTIFCDDELDASTDHALSTTTRILEAPRSQPAAGAASAPSSKLHPPGADKSGGFEIYCDNFAEDDVDDEPRATSMNDSQDPRLLDQRDSIPAKPSSAGFNIYCDEDDDHGSTGDKTGGLEALDVRVRRTEGSTSPVCCPYDDGDTASFSEMGDLLADLQQDPTVGYASGGHGWDNCDGDDGETADYEVVQRLLRRQSDGT